VSRATIGRLAGPSLLVVLLWAVATLVPAALDDTDEQLAETEEIRTLLFSDLADARDLPDEPDELADLDDRIAAAEVAVPEVVELAAFIRDVGAVGDQSGVSVEQIAPLSVTSDSDPESLISLPAETSSVTISVGASGTYEQVMTFASELRQLDRLVVTDLVALTADEEDSSLVTLDLELRIFTTDQLVATAEIDDEILDEAADGEAIDDGAIDGELDPAGVSVGGAVEGEP
jgi:Tfp pilus assembly protein PilO